MFSGSLQQQHHLARHSAAMRNMALKRRRQSFEMSNICNFHNVSCHQQTFSKQPKILNHNIRIVVGFKKPVCVLKMVIVDVGKRLWKFQSWMLQLTFCIRHKIDHCLTLSLSHWLTHVVETWLIWPWRVNMRELQLGISWIGYICHLQQNKTNAML